jgi:protein-S-isoprenylcysteine O-methyltransferase
LEFGIWSFPCDSRDCAIITGHVAIICPWAYLLCFGVAPHDHSTIAEQDRNEARQKHPGDDLGGDRGQHYGGSFVARSRSLRQALWMFELPESHWIPALAVALFALGLAVRWWALVILGRFFTVDVVIEKDHEVVERGPFRYVRHPSYSGVLLAFVGWALTLGNWAAIVVVVVPIFIAFVRRMNVEEKALRGALGDRYAEYMERTKRLVPGIY